MLSSGVQCGVSPNAYNYGNGRIVNGQQAHPNEWPWQVIYLSVGLLHWLFTNVAVHTIDDGSGDLFTIARL